MAMTGLLIVLVMIGESSLAADVGIVQAITLALFHSFSANARSLIFSHSSPAGAYSIMAVRLVLLLPLSGVAYWLSLNTASIDSMVAAALIFRRAMEWLSEVHACEIERKHQTVSAWCYLGAQLAAFFIVVVLILIGQSPWLGFLIWGLAPAVLGAGLAIKSLLAMRSPQKWLPSSMIPHFGSSAINGISVYVFRLLILASLGKASGGELFAAFAVGGIIGSVFANVLGPSVAMHEQRTGRRYSEKIISHFLYLNLLAGGVIAGVTIFGGVPNGWFGRSTIFWMAVGLSMIGGVLMVHAQRIRLHLIQTRGPDRDVFGPDVLMNILIVSAIPFLAYFGGIRFLASLYLLSSVLALLFYGSATLRDSRAFPIGGWSLGKVKVGIVVLLILPVFFQQAEWVFQSKQVPFDSGGVLANLPVPIGILGCYGGILALGMYARAHVSLGIIFSTFVLMVLSSLITFQSDQGLNQAKLVLLIQFVLPMFALVLGQMYEGESKSEIGGRLEHTLFRGGLLIMFLHLLASWLQGSFVLVPSLYFFSIYQYLEYVPIVLVSAVLIGYFGEVRFVSDKKMVAITAIVVGVYIGASVFPLFLFSFVAIFFFILWLRGGIESSALTVFVLGAIVAGGYIYWGVDAEARGEGDWQSYEYLARSLGATWYSAQAAWQYHFHGATSDLQTLLLGHLERPPRSEYPSAYNYYLGVVYNFGLVSILPLVWGICYTAIAVFRTRMTLLKAPGMLAFSAVLGYSLFVQSSVSVAMQQPYSAIFIFFIWGVYLSRLTAGTLAVQASIGR